MKSISIVIPNGHFSLTNAEASYQLFSWVNGYCGRNGRETPFQIRYVGEQGTVQDATGKFSVHVDATYTTASRPNLILLPAIHGDQAYNFEQNQALAQWLHKMVRAGAEVAGFCVGSYFLAATGLLEGRACSTHWQFAEDFQLRYPTIDLQPELVLTDDNGIYTSGGAFSFAHLLIYLVEKMIDRPTAMAAARAFMVYPGTVQQSPFMIFSGQKNHDDIQVRAVQEFIERNYPSTIRVPELCRQFGIGRRSLERRFKAATANTITEYIQRVKVEAAKQELASSRKSVTEIMLSVGYQDSQNFRRLFRRFAGLAPLEYRRQFRGA